MKVKYRIFKSAFQSWDNLFNQASEFATRIGKDQVIGISHSCDHKNEGVVTVWYWAD